MRCIAIFDGLELNRMLAIKNLNAEYAELLSEKKSDHAEYVTWKKTYKRNAAT